MSALLDWRLWLAAADLVCLVQTFAAWPLGTRRR
jgi:hypothetical protein